MLQDKNTLQQGLLSNVKHIILKRVLSRNRWTARFEAWARPLSATEDEKCQNAERIIRSAVYACSDLKGLNIDVFTQGSHRANMNVRADSDIDVNVRCNSFYHHNLPEDMFSQKVETFPKTLTYQTYRLQIARALFARFGINNVTVGDKAFNVKENSYRITADVIPTFEYRQYYLHDKRLFYKTGVCFYSTSGKFIVNWPEQTIANGIAKNKVTNRRYKRVVRVLKGIRNEMDAEGYESAKKISSFQIACLAYNVLNSLYNEATLYDQVKNVATQIWYHASEPSKSTAWTEIDEIKPMFPSNQPNKHQEVVTFFWDLIEYVGFRD